MQRSILCKYQARPLTTGYMMYTLLFGLTPHTSTKWRYCCPRTVHHMLGHAVPPQYRGPTRTTTRAQTATQAQSNTTYVSRALRRNATSAPAASSQRTETLSNLRPQTRNQGSVSAHQTNTSKRERGERKEEAKEGTHGARTSTGPRAHDA